MIRSMTAFARVQIPSKGKNWVIEIRSVNQRYFELSLKLPPRLVALENQIRQLVQRTVCRGKVNLVLYKGESKNQEPSYEVDSSQVRAYLRSAKKLTREFGVGGDLVLHDLIKLPGVVGEKVHSEEEIRWPEIRQTLKLALKKLDIHRREEGQKLEKDIRLRLARISRTLQKIAQTAKKNEKRIFLKLSDRVTKLLDKKEEKADRERFYREVAFLAERSDITEEIVRLKSHLTLFYKRLEEKREVGRELDFFCQEINREANTIAAKSQLFEVSKEAVFLKGELEKIREQIQNVE